MSLSDSVYAGTAVSTTGTFTNPDSSDPVDPTTITLKFRAGGGATSTWVYGGTGSIVRAGVGVYSAVLDTTGSAECDWQVEWIGTGACAAVQVAAFSVAVPPL